MDFGYFCRSCGFYKHICGGSYLLDVSTIISLSAIDILTQSGYAVTKKTESKPAAVPARGHTASATTIFVTPVHLAYSCGETCSG